MAIDCFDKIKLQKLKRIYESKIKKGMSDQELRDIGTQVAIDYFNELNRDIIKTRKSLGNKKIKFTPFTLETTAPEIDFSSTKIDKVEVKPEAKEDKVEVKPEAKEKIIREPRKPAQPKKPSERKVEASEYYNELSKKGVKPKQVIAEMYKKYPPSVVKDVLNKADIVSVSTIKNQSELRQVAKDLLDNARVAKGVLKLNKETVNKIANKINEIQKEVKKYLPSFQIKSSTVKQILKKPATLDLTIDKAEELVVEVSDIIERAGKEPIIKYINKTIKSVVKPKKTKTGKPSSRLSKEAQVYILEASEMLSGINLKNMSFDQLKNISENIANIESKGKADKNLTEKIERAASLKRKGQAATGAYSEGSKKQESVELNSLEEVKDFIKGEQSGERLVIIKGNLVGSKNALDTFIKDNPEVDFSGSKGYETMTMAKAKRATDKVGLRKSIQILDPTKQMANVVTLLGRVGKNSPELKKLTEDLVNSITEEAPFLVEQRITDLNKKLRKELIKVYGETGFEKTKIGKYVTLSNVKANRFAMKETPKGLIRKEPDIPLTNGIVIDLAVEQKVHSERAKVKRDKAAKEENEKVKKSLLEKAKEMDNILQISGIDQVKFNEYVKNNPQISKTVDAVLSFFKGATDVLKPFIEAETNQPLVDPYYYATYRAEVEPDPVQLDLDKLTSSDPYYNASAMTDRLKAKDYDSTKPLNINTDYRAKIVDYMTNITHAEAYIPISKKINQIMNPSVRGKIYEKVGKRNFESLRESLDAIIDPKRANPIDKTLDAVTKFNRFGIVTTLGFNLASIPKQMTSFSHYGFAGGKDGISVGDWAETMVEIPFNKEYREVAGKILTSEFVRNRILKSDIDPALKSKAIKSLQTGAEKAYRLLQTGALAPVIIGDIAGVLSGGIPFAVAKYKKVKKTKAGEFDEKAYIEAYKRFSAESNLAQQSSVGYSMTPSQRNKLLRVALTYRTAQIQAFNKAMQGWQDMTDKSNSKKKRQDGFKRWIYFTVVPGTVFSMAASGGFAALAGAVGFIEEYYDDKSNERILWDSIAGGFESYLQGLGLWGYLPLMVTNHFRGKPSYFNLPGIGSVSERLYKIGMDLLSGKDITEKSKKFLIGNLDELIQAIDKKGAKGFVEELLGKSKAYEDPLYETVVKGKKLELPEFINIRVKKKKEKENDAELDIPMYMEDPNEGDMM